MVSMKKDAEPEGNAASETCVSSDELYPYGLLLNLCDTDMVIALDLGLPANAVRAQSLYTKSSMNP